MIKNKKRNKMQFAIILAFKSKLKILFTIRALCFKEIF